MTRKRSPSQRLTRRFAKFAGDDTGLTKEMMLVQKERNVNRGIHSEFMEHSQQSLGTLNVGKSRV